MYNPATYVRTSVSAIIMYGPATYVCASVSAIIMYGPAIFKNSFRFSDNFIQEFRAHAIFRRSTNGINKPS